jgi:hypothetical protein
MFRVVSVLNTDMFQTPDTASMWSVGDTFTLSYKEGNSYLQMCQTFKLADFWRNCIL